MKAFDKIINEYQLLSKAKAIKLLKEHNLYDSFKSTYALLIEDPINSYKNICLTSLVSNFLTLTANKISAIQSNVSKAKIESLSLFVSENFLHEYVKINGNAKHIHECISQIKDAVVTTCLQCNYNFLPYEKLLQHKLECLKLNIIENKITPNDNIIEIKCYKIHWGKKGSLSELVDILKRDKYIARKNSFFDFIISTNDGRIVKWDGNRKKHLTHMLFRLFNEGYASITPDKGYFCCAERLFTDMEGNPFKQGSLKKISSKINREKDKHMDIRKDIDAIIKEITKGTKGL